MLYNIYLYISRAQPTLSKLKIATKKDNITALYKHLVDMGLKLLQCWNIVSII